jgi:hypothetical protein
MRRGFEIPKDFMGIPVSQETVERVLGAIPAAEPEATEPTPSPASVSVPSRGDYIILPGKKHGTYEYPDLLVAKEVSRKNKNWNECWDELARDQALMLTPRQYVDFLNVLRSGNAVDGAGRSIARSELSDIYNEITEVKSPWRSEWLDAWFGVQASQGLASKLGSKVGIVKTPYTIAYHVIEPNGSLRKVVEHLDDSTLVSDKTPGIKVQDWLANATYQGLPKSDIEGGDLHYWHPRADRVARFNANSVGANLGCGRDPADRLGGLGVREARKKI